jgi:hypothetical protein
MCLLVTQQYDSPSITPDWIADFSSSNPDGIGVMYAQDGELIIEKLLFKSQAELQQFFTDHIDGRDCAFHFRMKTHGNIDMENCHPYEVLNKEEHGIDLWMMHNGILHTGNKADTTKSDTWHYIRDYIRPLLKGNPDLAFSPVFMELVGDHIGNNRFVFMDNFGRMAVVNEDQGVYWGGRWMSNTYAWTAPLGVNKNILDDMYDLQKAQTDIATAPQRYEYPKYSKYGKSTGTYGTGYTSTYNNPYAHNNGYAFGNYNDEDYEMTEFSGHTNAVASYSHDLDLDVDDALTDLELAGFTLVGKFSRRQANSFAERFGINSFFELTEMVLDQAIDEESFIRIMSDFSKAKEWFPFLAEAEKAIKQAEYNL